MNKQTKTDIVQAALAFMKTHELGQKTVADQSGINISYLNVMLKGETSVTVQDKPVAIADKWFIMLARFVGYVYDKEYWPFVPSTEFTDIVNVLSFAKENAFTNIVICETGYGKTHAVQRFVKKHPQHTYVVTASRLHKISEVLTDLTEAMGLPYSTMNSTRLKKIITKLRQICFSDGHPLIIIDEAENLSLPVLQTLKALYDGIHSFCGIVLIGTPKLVEKLDKMEARNTDGMPQFCRRFRAGRRVIRQSNDFKPFFEKLQVADAGLQKLVSRLARNYGELRDYLEPVIMYADRQNMLLTETLFRQFHYL